MYKMITTGLLCIAAVALKAQDAPIDSVDHTKSNTLGVFDGLYQRLDKISVSHHPYRIARTIERS